MGLQPGGWGLGETNAVALLRIGSPRLSGPPPPSCAPLPRARWCLEHFNKSYLQCCLHKKREKILFNEQMHVRSELEALGCFRYYVRRVRVNKPEF